jgi:subtilisin-like proprotein convertase family protein
VTDPRTHAPRLTITDNAPAGVQSSIVVPPGERPTGEVKVRLDDLEHQYVGDLKLTLTGPSGRTVVLADEPGPGVGGSPANDLSGVVFDDAAADPIDAIPGTDTTVAPGSYRPEEPLAAFRGDPASGTWTLTSIDKRGGVTGSLGGWSLITRRFGCSNPAAATTGPVSAVTPRSARVAGTVDAGGVPTDYGVEYGAAAASPVASAGDGAGARDVAVTLTGLAPATTCHYRVVALRGGTVVATGADRTFTTQRRPTSPPATPTSPRVSVSFAETPTRIALRSRRFALRFTGTPGAAGTLRFAARGLDVAKPFRIAADGRTTVAVKLSRRRLRAGEHGVYRGGAADDRGYPLTNYRPSDTDLDF